MGAKTWEAVGLKWPGLQWRGWSEERRYRCTACEVVQTELEPFKHTPTCKHAAKEAA